MKNQDKPDRNETKELETPNSIKESPDDNSKSGLNKTATDSKPPRFGRTVGVKNKVILIAVLVALIAGGAAYALLSQRDESGNNNEVGQKNTEYSNIYNYASITDVVEFDGYTWVGLGSGAARYNDTSVEFYDQTDGLDGPGVGKFVVFNNQLWASTSGGVSRYLPDENTFKPYFSDVTSDGFGGGLGNVNLFENTVSNVLSVSSFKHFYEYNAQDDRFNDVEGPINTNTILFDENIGVAVVWPGTGTSFNVVYEYQDGQGWRSVVDLTMYADQMVYLRQVEDRFMVFGRNVDYENCNSQGVYPATLFNEYSAGGTLTPIAGLNAQFALYELSPDYEAANYEALTRACEDATDEKAYNFVVENGQISVKEVADPINKTDPGYTQPHLDTIAKLKELLGREPIFQVIGTEDDGTLITLYSDGIVSDNEHWSSSIYAAHSSSGIDLYLDQLALVDDSDFTSISAIGKVEAIDGETIDSYVLCNGSLTYFMPLRYDGFAGETIEATLFDVSTGQLDEVADLRDVFTTQFKPIAYCSNDKVEWLVDGTLVTFDRNTKQITTAQLETPSWGLALNGDNLWFSSAAYSHIPAGYRNMKTGEITSVDFNIDAGDPNDPKLFSFVGASNKYIWIISDINPNGMVQAYNHDGTLAYEYELAGSDGYVYNGNGTVLDDNRMVLLTESSYEVHKDVLVFDAAMQSVSQINYDFPVRDYIGDVVFNPADNLLWVNAGDALFSFPIQ